MTTCFCRIRFHLRIPASSLSNFLSLRQPPSVPHATFSRAPHTKPFSSPSVPVVSEGKAASRSSMVWGRRTVSPSQARPRQRSASFHPRPRTSLTRTDRRGGGSVWKGRQGVGAATDITPWCLKMLRCWSTPTTPFKLPSHRQQRWETMSMTHALPSFPLASSFQSICLHFNHRNLIITTKPFEPSVWSQRPGGVSTAATDLPSDLPDIQMS